MTVDMVKASSRTSNIDSLEHHRSILLPMVLYKL